jgi:hypothetical protein
MLFKQSGCKLVNPSFVHDAADTLVAILSVGPARVRPTHE